MTGTGYSLTQSMKLGQAMAPQMRQSLKMLQMTSLELRAELQHQMELNPVIEDVRSPLDRQMSAELPEEHAGAAVTERELDFTPGGEAAQTTLATDDGYRDYFLGNMESASGDEEAQSKRQHLFDSLVRTETLQEHLKAQVPLSDIAPEDRDLAVALIAHIDDDGYFRGSLPDIQMVTGASEAHVLRVLAEIQMFDPLGCGARDLRECLLAQMEKLDDSPWEDEVRALIDRHLPDVAARREGFICQSLHLAPGEYQKVLAELRTLNPKPGLAIRPPNVTKAIDVDRERDYVRPEVFVHPDGKGGWRATVPARDLPEIHISKKYQDMLADPDCSAETKAYIRERIRAAEALREAVANRQDTIRGIAQARHHRLAHRPQQVHAHAVRHGGAAQVLHGRPRHRVRRSSLQHVCPAADPRPHRRRGCDQPALRRQDRRHLEGEGHRHRPPHSGQVPHRARHPRRD